MGKIILASRSAGRKLMMEELGIPFEIVIGDYEEDMTLPMTPDKLALFLSQGKAKNVLEKCPEDLIIAADTFVVFEGKLMGKPKTKEEAIKMLMELSAKEHEVLTGLTVADKTKSFSEVVSSKIKMRTLSLKEVEDYVNTGEPLTKAGGYAIQNKSIGFFEIIGGEFSNIVGLPKKALLKILDEEFGLKF